MTDLFADAAAIQAAALATLSVLPAFVGYTLRHVPAATVDDASELPLLAVYFLRESEAAPSEVFFGEPQFDAEVTLGISVVVQNSDDAELAATLHTAAAAIKAALLTDDGDLKANPFVRHIEGVPSLTRQHVYSNDGRTYAGELRIELTVRTRTVYPTILNDDLKTIHVTTADNPPVEAEWTIPTT